LYKPEFIYESRRSGAFSFCFDKLHNTALKHRLGWFGVDNYAITYEEKGQQVTKVVRDKIYDLQVVDADTFLVTLACGNVNLRCDRLVNHLLAVNNLNADYSIVKIQMQTNGTDMDAFLQS